MYINLDHCRERRVYIEHELETMGITAERFVAIDREPGIVGTGLSHLEIIKQAKAKGWKNVMIFEDDFKFVVDKLTFESNLRSFFESNTPYDVILFNAHILKSEPLNDVVSYAKEAHGSSAYIVHERFYDELINTLDEANYQLVETQIYWLYARDKSWKSLQKTHVFLYFNAPIGAIKEYYRNVGQAYADNPEVLDISSCTLYQTDWA